MLLGVSELIDRATKRGTLLPNRTWESHTYNGPAATISYKIRVICDENYYGSKCTKYCQPRNDSFGHYTCDENGNKVCLPGWSGNRCEKGWSQAINTINYPKSAKDKNIFYFVLGSSGLKQLSFLAAICKTGCDPVNGNCHQPGECT